MAQFGLAARALLGTASDELAVRRLSSRRKGETVATTGRIKRLTDRNFGFIGVDGRDDVFFHASALLDSSFDSLREGQTVEFDVEVDPRGKGDRAANVKTT